MDGLTSDDIPEGSKLSEIPEDEWVCEVHGVGSLGECPVPGCIGPWMLAGDFED